MSNSERIKMRNPFTARAMIKSIERFWDREQETRDIYSLLLDAEEEPQSVAVIGLRRTGKSSILYHISQKRDAPEIYEDQLEHTLFIMLSMQSARVNSVDRFYETIIQEMINLDENSSRLLLPLLEENKFGRYDILRSFLRKLNEYDYQVILLLDEFEAVASKSDFNKEFFDNLRALAQEWRLAFIVATQTDLDLLWDASLVSSPHSSPFFNFFQTIQLKGFSKPVTVTNYLRNQSRNAGVEFIDSEIDLIRRVGGLHPFFINVAAYHVFVKRCSINKLEKQEFQNLWDQIINDPTLVSNMQYYWKKALNESQRKTLIKILYGEQISQSDNLHKINLYWLSRMGLVLQDSTTGNYKLFSEAFESVLTELASKNSSINNESEYSHSIEELISQNESTILEFKSSLRWDYRRKEINRTLEDVIVKSLAGFLNTNGGKLIIGVGDDGIPLGLDNDFKTLGKGRDGFELHLTEIVCNKLGKQLRTYIEVQFYIVNAKDICCINVNRSSEPVFVDNKEFYIRTGNSTRPLNMRETVAYINTHWK